MNRTTTKYLCIVATLIAALCGAVLWALVVGETPIHLTDIPRLLAEQSSMEYGVLAHIRIPRILLALAVGGGLSLSGVILQGVYRNPLVEPYTLGISGGASLGVTLAIIAGGHALGKLALPFFGFTGALGTIFLVYFLALRLGTVSINRMVLIGVMISFISSSLVMFLMSIAETGKIPDIVFWTMGSLNESNPAMVGGITALSLVTLAVSYCFTVHLNALRMGETRARHLGIDTQATIRWLFLLTALLTGSCIAVTGVIGFVGLVVPHAARFFVGTDHKILLVSSFLSGGIFLILSDIVSRTVIAPNELPIGVITGIVGGIAFIFILSRPHMKTQLN